LRHPRNEDKFSGIEKKGREALTDYKELRQRHVRQFAHIIPEYIQRLSWSAEQLRQERQRRLRDLLRVALAYSPWHRERLSGIDPECFCEEDLPTLPTMTKDDMMAHWDTIVTDRRLTLAIAERHLADLTRDAYLFDEFHVVSSGGSTGHRGVFAYGWEPWTLVGIGTFRTSIWDRMVSPELAAAPNRIAVVAADRASYVSSASTQTFANPDFVTMRFPVTQPIDEIVSALNKFEPLLLTGLPTGLSLLIHEAQAGRLRIAPRRIISLGEPLLPEVRRLLEETFNAPVANCYGTSEAGCMAFGCWRGPDMHLNDDLVIIEPVDSAGKPVPLGTRSDKIFVTSIINPTLPLIRIEVTDQVTILDTTCSCGSAHRLIEVEGRQNDIFVYDGGIRVHPFIFKSPLERDHMLVEYQVRQTPTGAEVLVLGTPNNASMIEQSIAASLAQAGLPSPSVHLRLVDHLERQASGKMRRYVPLTDCQAQEKRS
jgi:phenylacetate-CoA ligase